MFSLYDSTLTKSRFSLFTLIYSFCYSKGECQNDFRGCILSEQLKPPYIKRIDERDGLAVWAVDGAYIRGHIDEEFTNFGQHYRYGYIPENEFWIDRTIRDTLKIQWHLVKYAY